MSVAAKLYCHIRALLPVCDVWHCPCQGVKLKILVGGVQNPTYRQTDFVQVQFADK